MTTTLQSRATFRRMGVRQWRDKLLADEARRPEPAPNEYSRGLCERVITTYLRPPDYVLGGLPTGWRAAGGLT